MQRTANYEAFIRRKFQISPRRRAFYLHPRRAYACLGVSERLKISHYPKYREENARIYGGEMPKYGLTIEEYYERCYVDAPDHSFRAMPSLAILKECFGM